MTLHDLLAGAPSVPFCELFGGTWVVVVRSEVGRPFLAFLGLVRDVSAAWVDLDASFSLRGDSDKHESYNPTRVIRFQRSGDLSVFLYAETPENIVRRVGLGLGLEPFVGMPREDFRKLRKAIAKRYHPDVASDDFSSRVWSALVELGGVR